MKLNCTASYMFFFLLFFSCTSKKNEPKKSLIVKETETPAPIKIQCDKSLNDFYKILAGDSLVILENTDEKNKIAALRNSNISNKMWSRMYTNLLTPISNWKDNNIPSNCTSTDFVFYPFSGPDFLIPNTIFQKAKHMIMFGLEMPGKDMSSNGINFALNSLPLMQKSLRDYFGKSYFITKNMMSDLKSDSLNGVTPLIATFLVKSNYHLMSIKNFKLNNNGEKVYFEQGKDTFSVSNVIGVEINYTKDYTDSLQIEYLSFNAEDPSIKYHPEVLSFFEKNVPTKTTSYLKSASYLLHYESFSLMRNLILKKSKFILQDDTGIASKYFSSDWKFSLWGVYEKPVKDFSGVYQQDLDSLYKVKRPVSSLPFNMGYHYFNNKQNLMLAESR